MGGMLWALGTHTHELAHVHRHVEVCIRCHVSSLITALFIYWDRFFLNSELTNFSQLAYWRNGRLLPLKFWGSSWLLCLPNFSVSSEDLNSGPSTYISNALSTRPTPKSTHLRFCPCVRILFNKNVNYLRIFLMSPSQQDISYHFSKWQSEGNTWNSLGLNASERWHSWKRHTWTPEFLQQRDLHSQKQAAGIAIVHL